MGIANDFNYTAGRASHFSSVTFLAVQGTHCVLIMDFGDQLASGFENPFDFPKFGALLMVATSFSSYVVTKLFGSRDFQSCLFLPIFESII